MLMYHWKDELNEIFFYQEKKKKLWIIKDAQSRVIDFKEHLLFVHAWSGCDLTSSILGKRKPSFLKLLQKSNNIQSVSEIILDYWATKKEVRESAVRAFIEVFGGNAESSLRKMRYLKYKQMVCEGIIKPEKLPPTDHAAYFHGLRVHLQVVEWQMLDESFNLDPKEWGWKLDNGCLLPIPTDKEVAPPNILKVIRCDCKTSSRNMCGTNMCSCRKNGLKCMSACGGCHGQDCRF
ncbi:uncharacterized protein LOC136079741 [Hydra vulgaris]|uniref:Uncharacterized protein LOC136079741 n=1 Tax=Hydra vulgaris TaxID=6087 RepID=A0ABM4BSG4_HYDVU